MLPPETPIEAPEPRFAPLTGMLVSQEDYVHLEQRRPFAVMIDNIIDATPQSGLDRADVVIEALVEGGITRFLAVFHSQDAELIQPVRSARTPFLYWTLEYDAVYAHVGSATLPGPADAGRQILDWGVSDLDSATRAGGYAYARDANRKAPHNMFTSTAHLRTASAVRGYERAPALSAWRFAEPEGGFSGQPANTLSLRFGALSPNFSVRWDWDPDLVRYVRSQYGRDHNDAASGRRLAAANVVVQYANARIVDQSGHVLMDLVGEGRVQVFRNGEMTEGVWWKPDRTARTRFYVGDEEMTLMPGPTWIEVVSTLGGGATIR